MPFALDNRDSQLNWTQASSGNPSGARNDTKVYGARSNGRLPDTHRRIFFRVQVPTGAIRGVAGAIPSPAATWRLRSSWRLMLRCDPSQASASMINPQPTPTDALCRIPICLVERRLRARLGVLPIPGVPEPVRGLSWTNYMREEKKLHVIATESKLWHPSSQRFAEIWIALLAYP
jgi:hypothetical protein